MIQTGGNGSVGRKRRSVATLFIIKRDTFGASVSSYLTENTLQM